MADIVLYRPHFVAFIILFLLGIYIMVVSLNLIKKLIGMYLMQTSIILFFITLAVKKDSTIPIILSSTTAVTPEAYANPLPHVLMLTAIVVGVSTLGVSLAMVIALYRQYNTLEEDQILGKMQ
jgi:multicomponent Na+:H+ antiporter subunit C